MPMPWGRPWPHNCAPVARAKVGPMPTRTLVTRPAPEAAHWVAALQGRGLLAQALPLIHISPPTHAASLAALQQAQQALANYQAIMLVSGQAARFFCSAPVIAAFQALAASGAAPRWWAPGPGTARTLLQCGLPAHSIDQPAADANQFDSEALWQQVAAQIQPGSRVLIVRGSDGAAPQPEGHGRDWLAQQLVRAGAQVEKVVAYQRQAPQFSAAQRILAQQAASDGTLWLFSSSQAIANLQAQLPAQSWQQARALTTHPRIADAARAAGFATVVQCRPALEDVAISIESML